MWERAIRNLLWPGLRFLIWVSDTGLNHRRDLCGFLTEVRVQTVRCTTSWPSNYLQRNSHLFMLIWIPLQVLQPAGLMLDWSSGINTKPNGNLVSKMWQLFFAIGTPKKTGWRHQGIPNWVKNDVPQFNPGPTKCFIFGIKVCLNLQTFSPLFSTKAIRHRFRCSFPFFFQSRWFPMKYDKLKPTSITEARLAKASQKITLSKKNNKNIWEKLHAFSAVPLLLTRVNMHLFINTLWSLRLHWSFTSCLTPRSHLKQ